MLIKFREMFDKDLDGISDKIVRNEILKVVENVANASKPKDIHQFFTPPLKGDFRQPQKSLQHLTPNPFGCLDWNTDDADWTDFR